MKKFIASLSVATVLFVATFQMAFALLPVYVLDCTVIDSCVVYVDDSYNAAPPSDGTKDFPYKTITAALNKVIGDDNYNRIRIAQGTYKPSNGEVLPLELNTANVAHSIYVEGGWSSWTDGFSERNPESFVTSIDAEGAGKVFFYNGIGGGISGLQIHNLHPGGLSSATGIDVDLTSGGPTTITVADNVVYDVGGFGGSGISVEVTGGNSAVVSGNELYEVSTLGGALSVMGDVDAFNNVLHDSTSFTTVNCSDGAFVYNNFVIENSPLNAVYAGGGCTVQHNTIVRNDLQNADPTYGAVVMENGGNVVSNNLITHNNGNDSSRHIGGDTSVFEYNALFANGADPADGMDNNHLCDPNYAVTSGTNPDSVKMNDSSSCVDTGKNIASIATDYYGTTRPADGDGDGNADSDPGAYEVPAALVTAPTISNLGVTVDPFSPDDDGNQDTTTLSFQLDVDADVSVEVQTLANVTVKVLASSEAKTAGSVSYVWDGKDTGGSTMSEDTYKFVVAASNTGGSDSGEVEVAIAFAPLPSPGNQCAGYTDVPASHPDCAAIEYMQSIGAMTGNPDGTFAPNQPLQRDQVAKISLETFGLFDSNADYCGGNDPFPDVPPSQWSYQYICRGVELDMITGYLSGADAGYYRPAREVNRVEFLALVLRNLSDPMPSNNSTSYADVEAGQWFSGYARYSMDMNLFEGNLLHPAQQTMRVEVAEVIHKLHLAGKI